MLDEDGINQYRERIELWLAALLQAEHLNLLIGGGLTTAIAHHTCATAIDMSVDGLECEYSEAVLAAAARSAKASGREKPNIEDAIRAARELIQGLAVFSTEQKGDDDFLKKAKSLHELWAKALEKKLVSFLGQVLENRGRDTLGG